MIKHARAQNLFMQLIYDNNKVELCVQDDGQGFDLSNTIQHHFGLKIMKERAFEAGITLEILTSLGQGTTLKAIWLDKAEA